MRWAAVTFLASLLGATLTTSMLTRVARAEEPSPTANKAPYVELFATTFLGDGLRFNNPYRLATPLGSSAESISRTAAYTDVGLAATLGDPFGFRHGLALRMSIAVEGVDRKSVV